MNSSKNGTNKIAPLEIEALETISSNLEKGNKNVPATFSKTENSTVQEISDATDNETDSIHYITWLFGILLTCAALISTLIVPWHNVMKEPFYWYEIYIYNAPPSQAFIAVNYIMRLEYWAGIMYDKKIYLFFFLFGIGGVFYAVIALFYYYIYVYNFELFAPLPYGFITGALCTFVFLVPLLFFRYHNTSTYRVRKWNFSPS